MVLSLITFVLAHTPQSGFLPYSFAPAMGYSAPAFASITSEMVHTVEATVTDTDTYQRAVAPNDFQVFPNVLTDIAGTINSGTILSVTTSYDNTTGKRTKTWVVQAPTVPNDTYIMRYNYFIAKDTGSGVVKDADSPQQTMAVQINGPKSAGGGGV